jgi:hypothetical protein
MSPAQYFPKIEESRRGGRRFDRWMLERGQTAGQNKNSKASPGKGSGNSVETAPLSAAVVGKRCKNGPKLSNVSEGYVLTAGIHSHRESRTESKQGTILLKGSG